MSPRSTICLAMMVHNEAHYLQRVWDNIGHRLDAACLIIRPEYDDNSLEVAQDVFHNVPNKILSLPDPTNPHRGFDTSRQELTDLARTFDTDYVLWTDPDNPIIGVIPNVLTEQYYEIQHHAQGGSLVWWATHLVRKDAKFKWLFRVHELIDVFDPPQELHKITSCYIDHSEVGGDKNRALNLYIPLLLEDHKENPLEPRTVFNLGRSYALAEDWDNAIKYYTMRLGLKGFDEERYYSLYQIGIILRHLKQYKDAEMWLMRAFSYRPSRREAYRELISLYGSHGSIEIAQDMFEHYQNIQPCDDILLVEDGVR